MSSPITMNVTGLDTETMIQELMKLERRPLLALESKQQSIGAKKAAWTAIKTKLESLLSKIKPLLDNSVFDTKAIQIKDKGVISAAVSSNAALGSYDVEVIKLAQSHVVQSTVFTQKPDEALGIYGTINLGLDGGEDGLSEIEIFETDSLNSIADKINTLEGVGVKASVLQVNPSELRLVLTAEATGQSIQYEDNLTGPGLEPVSFGMTTAREQAKAVFKINGVEFTRNSNHVSDAIQGVSFNLLSTGSSDFSVGYDDDAVVSAVKGFISEYNSLLDTAGKYTTWDSTALKGGLLFGDPLLQKLVSQVRQTLFSDVSSQSQVLRFIGQIGISTGSIGAYSRDGKLSLDEAKLKEALGADRGAVASLLNKDGDGSDGVFANMQKVLQVYVSHDGLLSTRDAQLELENKDVSRQIENLERRLEIRLSSLKRQFSALETLLMRMNSQGLWLAQQIQGFYSS